MQQEKVQKQISSHVFRMFFWPNLHMVYGCAERRTNYSVLRGILTEKLRFEPHIKPTDWLPKLVCFGVISLFFDVSRRISTRNWKPKQHFQLWPFGCHKFQRGQERTWRISSGASSRQARFNSMRRASTTWQRWYFDLFGHPKRRKPWWIHLFICSFYPQKSRLEMVLFQMLQEDDRVFKNGGGIFWPCSFFSVQRHQVPLALAPANKNPPRRLGKVVRCSMEFQNIYNHCINQLV